MYKEFDLSIMILRALLSANAVEVIRLNTPLYSLQNALSSIE